MPPANQIRIIVGRWRGRRVRFPPREGVRPTPDRVRETLFNWLGQDLTGATTLDPFTGSGALSLEALSRGAALAVAIDRSAALVRALAATGAALGAAALEAHCADAHVFLARETRLFDVIFLDPPFDEAAWPAVTSVASALSVALSLAWATATWRVAGRSLRTSTLSPIASVQPSLLG